MGRLLTPEQTKRAFKKESLKHIITDQEQLKTVLFNYVDNKLINDVFIDTLVELYAAGYITDETLEDASDGMYMYYGDVVMDMVDNFATKENK
jgi:hypothetical protein